MNAKKLLRSLKIRMSVNIEDVNWDIKRAVKLYADNFKRIM